jgi:hypothetical protein
MKTQFNKSLVSGLIRMAVIGGLSLMSSNSFSLTKDGMLKASYVQLDAVGSLGMIPQAGIAASNIIVFGFADPNSSNLPSGYANSVQSIVGQEAPNTLNLLSLGGQTVTSIANPSQTVLNVDAQIKALNAVLPSNKKITGVDLDLENAIPASTILELAQGFKSKSYIVSIAPQVYTSGGDINVKSPSNLVLTSGGTLASQNTYGQAISANVVDYIMAQTYNTGGFSVGGYQENQEPFVKAVAQALNNATTQLKIPDTTKILIGEPSNQGAGGQYTIFNPNAVWPIPATYDHGAILAALASDITSMQQATTGFEHIAGFMQWSLNNDYYPSGWGDNQAIPGGFSNAIFSAPLPPAVYFILQETNTGSQNNASITLKVNNQYYVFGQQDNATLPNGYAVSWGTLASSNAQGGVIDSSSLDTLFAKNTSISATVIGNSYDNWQTPISQPTKQSSGQAYTFEVGHSYNVLFNPDTMVMQIKKMN